MQFVPLVPEADVENGYRQVFSVEQEDILLIKSGDEIFAVENSCGHFGLPLDNGRVSHGTIRCPSHAVKFDLQNGTVLNNLYDDCQPIKVYTVTINDGWIGITL